MGAAVPGVGARALLAVLLVVLVGPVALRGSPGGRLHAGPCRLSEFLCDTGQCIALDRVCDGRDDCEDKSDERPFCTPCNRTYYGDADQTYDLEIRRPREDRLPFICHINFTAAGGEFGDLVQLTFDTFTVGKFTSFTSDGCPDGHMTLREEGRPTTGGQWCGSAWGYTVYYSETRGLNLTLELRRLSEQGIGYNFDFKLAFKFLRRSSAKLRYGNSSLGTWRGDLVPGTYCDRVLDRCDQRPCRVQSPNYPGVYPRNATCRYRIEQRTAPPDKHALIAVRQRFAHKVHIKDQALKYDREQRMLKVWDQCNVVQDHLTVYDGGGRDSPMLVRMCGGDAVPEIVSSGPKMLLEFHTSPFDSPYHPAPLSYLPGFELEVQVLFVDARSSAYVKDPLRCEFHMTSFESSWGWLENPRHSLPPNTTCRYHFQGKPRDTVWLSFVKYHAAPKDPAYDTAGECNARLSVWDGRYGNSKHKGNNASLLGEFCRDTVPKLCAHALLANNTRTTRPCSTSESYVSKSPELTLEQFLRQGSALHPLTFALRYEFVDTALEGTRDSSSTNPCDRVFRSTPNVVPSKGRFLAPKSVFFYGRGGSQNLSCIFRFEAASGERIKLTLTRARFGNRPCAHRQDPRTGRWECLHAATQDDTGSAELWVTEQPWPGIPLARDCLCAKLSAPVVISTLTSSVVELNFTVARMNITDDYNDFHFEGEYEFIGLTDSSVKSGGPPACAGARAGEQRLMGPSGEVTLRRPAPPTPPTPQDGSPETAVAAGPPPTAPPPAPEDLEALTCARPPWLIEPEDLGHYIYLQIHGSEMFPHSARCSTKNRVVVRPTLDSRKIRVFCPAEANSVEASHMFSDGWDPRTNASHLTLLTTVARGLIVELVQREDSPLAPGPAPHVTWIQVSRRPLTPAASSTATSTSSFDCPYRCPQLNACIPRELWCDGVRHCPSGFDEDESNCAFQFGVPMLYIVTGAGALAVLLVLVCVTACVQLCRRWKRARHSAKNKMTPPMGHGLGPPIGPLGSNGPIHPLGGMGPYGPMGSANHHHLHVNHLHSNGEIKTTTLSKRYPGPPEDFYFDGKDSLC